MRLNFDSPKIKKAFYDPFDFTLDIQEQTQQIILNQSNFIVKKEIQKKLIHLSEQEIEQNDIYNEVEVDNLINEFMEENPKYFPNHQDEYDQDKISNEIKSLEKKMFSNSFQTIDQIFDSYENKFVQYHRQKIQKDPQMEIPKIQPNFDSFENFLNSIEYSIPEEQIQKKNKFIFTPEGSSEITTKLFSKEDEKTLEEVDLYLNSIRMAKTYPFELDEFQKRAIYFIEMNQNVFVAAHTSAGKTVVAEYAIAKALKNKSKVIFTSPIKALSNQKYYEFSKKFDKNVGIITGDMVLKQESNCLIMTTEILRNKLFNRCDTLENLEWVIFDEVHYINDSERGSVWEETIILLPRNVGIVMLSATVENVKEFRDWVQRTTQKRLNVLRTYQRPVPLRHFIYYQKELLIKEHNKNFDENAYKQLLLSLEEDKKKRKFIKDQKRKELQEKKLDFKKNQYQKGRLRKITRNKTNKNNMMMRCQIDKMPMRTDRNSAQLISAIKKLNSDEKLPAIVFVFSKKTLNSLADKAAESLNLVTAEERKRILTFYERSVRRLKSHDRQIFQLVSLKNMLMKGVGVHHGDLLWICKEIVELLFQQNLLKLLFATESFAMGINVPTKSVIFYSIRKMDGQQFRFLKSGEYTQMCGRAGRRGIDKQGDVYIFYGDAKDMPKVSQLRPMLLNKGEVLESKFRLTYSTIINSFTMNNFKVNDLIKKSFTENQSYLKINTLNKEQDFLNKQNTNNQILCKFFDNQKLDLEQKSFITLHEYLLTQIKEKCFNYNKTINSKQLDKNLKLPLLVLVLDQKNNFHYILVNHFKVDRNNFIFEGFYCEENQPYKTVFLRQNIYKKVKYYHEQGQNFKVYFFEFEFTEIISICELEKDFPIKNHIYCLDYLAKKKQEFQQNLSYTINNEIPDKIKNHFLSIFEIFEKLKNNQCFTCDQLFEHENKFDEIKKVQYAIESNANEIQRLEKSFGKETFRNIIKILQDLNFMDHHRFPTINMKNAKTLSAGPEVILLTMIFNYNLIGPLEAEEVPALLSLLCMTSNIEPDFQEFEKILEESSFSSNLTKSLYDLSDIYFDIKRKEKKFGIVFEDYIVYDLIVVIYEWCNGCEFRNLYLFTDRLEGSIVRGINKIEKYIESLRYLYIQKKKKDIVFKLEKSLKLLRRDILNVQSLYLTG